MANCPDATVLKQFLSNELPDELVVRLKRHLASCRACTEILQRLQADARAIVLALERVPGELRPIPPRSGVEPGGIPRTLAQHLEERERLSLDESLAITLDVLQELEGIHAAGHVHGCVEPKSVMLSNGRARLRDVDQQALSARRAGSLTDGKAAAAERTRELRHVGRMMQEMLCGRPKFDSASGSIADLETVADPRMHRVARVLARATHRDRTRRFQSARAFRRALQSLTPEYRNSRRKRMIVALVVVGAACAAIRMLQGVATRAAQAG